MIGDGLWVMSRLWAVSGSGALGVVMGVLGEIGGVCGICWWEMEEERGR